MKRINLLDENTANKIAAGEVVERPSSVVKELIENSIDANSTDITIQIEEGGSALIRIVDNGDGIYKEDIKKAFLPHATSKIKDVSDIFRIESLGFRGEALASIASVSKVNLKSRTESEEFGREITINGGEIIEENECGCNKGTTIEVRDLFFNVPARKKFLKSFTREESIIADIVNRIAIVNPDISFKLYRNGKKILHTFGKGNTKDVLRAIYGKSISDNIIFFKSDRDIISVSGFIGKESIARGSRNNQSIFVNGRYIKNKSLVAAVENAFKSFSTVNKFPFFVLKIEIYPEYVDVNIHPTKAEVKFKDDRLIFKTVFDAVHSSLKNDVFDSFIIPEEEIEKPIEKTEEPITFNISLKEEDSKIQDNSFLGTLQAKDYLNNAILQEKEALETLKKDINARNNLVKDNPKKYNYNVDSNYNLNNKEETLNTNPLDTTFKYSPDNIKESTVESPIKEEKTAKFPPLNVIGQFHKTYILCEFNDILYIIDQHAAHEKILFEKYIGEIQNGQIVVQPLLVPVLIDLTTDDLAYYEENTDVFKNAGFLIEGFGENTITIKEVPYFLGKLDSKHLFLEILDNLKNLGNGKTTEIKYNKIATMACKSAVKGNDRLDYKEMVELINKLRFIDDPFHCPHGRPTIIKFTSTDLDKKFRRIV